MTDAPVEPTGVHDVVGVGFGPANLALAIALRESTAGGPLDIRFFEKQERFGWHRGALLPGTRMQVAFLKDLVTMRNPVSPYSFVAYLHRHGRLPAFVNAKTFFPFRSDFHKYLEWVADDLRDVVEYGRTVTSIDPVWRSGRLSYLDLTVNSAAPGWAETVRTRNVVLGQGTSPWLPPGIVPSRRIWHSADVGVRLGAAKLSRVRRVAVVGAGQSAAEVLRHLHAVCVDVDVYAILPRFGYSVADDSPFANRIFDPHAVDMFFDAPEVTRRRLLEYHANTNYSVVDANLTEAIYDAWYEEEVRGGSRLTVLPASRVAQAREVAGEVHLTVEDQLRGALSRRTVDLAVFATGYRPADTSELLKNLKDVIRGDPDDWPPLDRNYRVGCDPVVDAGLYLHGAGAEASHGLSAGLLSNVGVRAGEIADQIVANVHASTHRQQRAQGGD
jgi:L-ornithine N5-oxygenase